MHYDLDKGEREEKEWKRQIEMQKISIFIEVQSSSGDSMGAKVALLDTGQGGEGGLKEVPLNPALLLLLPRGQSFSPVQQKVSISL